MPGSRNSIYSITVVSVQFVVLRWLSVGAFLAGFQDAHRAVGREPVNYLYTSKCLGCIVVSFGDFMRIIGVLTRHHCVVFAVARVPAESNFVCC